MSACIHRSSRSRLVAILVSSLAPLAGSFVHANRAGAVVWPTCFGKPATIIGSNDGELLRGTKKADVIVALGGRDRIEGGGGADRICGGGGRDRIFGGFGNDQINGGPGTDDCFQEVGTGTKKNCEGPKYQLTVSKAGTGTGTVKSSPSAIACGQICVMGFFEGQKITLTASADGSSTFDGWSGPCTGTSSCVLMMTKTRAVTAVFSAGPSSSGGTNPPPLTCAAPCYVVSKTGDSYMAIAPSTGTTHAGTLKLVVESAVRDLNAAGGGGVFFAAGVFDLGPDRFSLHDIANIEFAGQGMDATLIQNFSTESPDSEPFDMHDTNRIVIRDMTVNAGGTRKTTSDAIDFDGGNDVLIERVKIAESRSRGIVFDGKDFTGTLPRTADGNIVRDCVIIGIPDDGIELLAASNNRVEGCTITNVGGRGIQITKSAPDPVGQGGAPVQANKKSNHNRLIGNVIDQSGYDGVEVVSGDQNVVDSNVITNSSDDVSSRDGIRISSFDSVTCDDNVVRNNRATDTQATKTQSFGLRITDALCNRTVVGPSNDFTDNRVGDIRDDGTATQYI